MKVAKSKTEFQAKENFSYHIHYTTQKVALIFNDYIKFNSIHTVQHGVVNWCTTQTLKCK
jgi:hypothetical protein